MQKLTNSINSIKRSVSKRAKIVCLCGSTRFGDAFRKAAEEETLRGNEVLTIDVNTTENPQLVANMTPSEFDQLMEMLVSRHLQKIKKADEVVILNVGGVIGKHTQNELNYAITNGKPCRFLEPFAAPKNLPAEVAAWASVNIPPEADQIAKLREELDELALSPADPGEIGDLLIGLLHHAAKHQIDAFAAAADKFEIVKTRKYAMQPDGTCRHS
jgi:hypothetical protein